MIQRQRARHGFTLLEMLVVIAIIGILVALLLPTLAAARRSAKNAATKATMHNLKIALENYRMDAGTFPITPTGTGLIFDSGGSYNPGYYGTSASTPHPCAGLAAVATGTETNQVLVDLLTKTRFLDVQKNNIVNKELLDHFGTPIIVRTLVLPPGTAGGEKLTEKLYIWSYGSDKKNDVDASGTYLNKGLPVYDEVEAQKIEASPAKEADDITIWR